MSPDACIIFTTCVLEEYDGMLLKYHNLCHHLPIVEYFDCNFLLFRYGFNCLFTLNFQKWDYFSLFTHFTS